MRHWPRSSLADRPVAVGIIDDMDLGAARRIGEPRPLFAAPIEPEASRINQVDRIIQPPAQMPTGAADHQREHLAEEFRGAARIGIGQRPALHRARAQMVQPCLMAVQAGDDVAQARGPGQLAVKQRHQLAFCGQPANSRIGPVHRHRR
jgi:hypothetical protein